jgi:hypothetical protein
MVKETEDRFAPCSLYPLLAVLYCRTQPCQLPGRRALHAFPCRALAGLCVARIRSTVLRLDSNDMRKNLVAAVEGFSTKYLAKG